MDAREIIKAAEGLRLAAYWDKDGSVARPGDEPRGTCTIGYGSTGPDVVPGLIWTQAQADAAFAADYAHAVDGALQAVGRSVWAVLDEVRQAALVDMAFTMGQTRLREFHRMLLALCRGEYAATACECLASTWASEALRRARRDATMFETGQWPQEAAP